MERTDRQKKLYFYLIQNADRIVPAEELTKELYSQYWADSKHLSPAYTRLRQDILALKCSIDLQYTVISTHEGYKIGNHDEVCKEQKKYKKKLIRCARVLKAIAYRKGVDGQAYLNTILNDICVKESYRDDGNNL